MDLLAFIIGFFCGTSFIHVLYLAYFHMFIIGRLETELVETRSWIDKYLNTPPPSIAPIIDAVSSYKPKLGAFSCMEQNPS